MLGIHTPRSGEVNENAKAEFDCFFTGPAASLCMLNNKKITFPLQYSGNAYNINDELRSEASGCRENEEKLFLLFEKYGPALFGRLKGAFSIAVFDEKLNILYLGCDSAGIEPVYYSRDENGFAFSSSLSGLKNFPAVSFEIDYSSLALYFRYRFIPPPYTIFKNIYKLPPSSFITYNLITGSFALNEYEDSSYYPAGRYSEKEALLEIERILLDSVNRLAGSCSSTGILLTGGYDSTAAAALLQAQRDYKIKTFTVGMGDAGFTEAPYARRIAAYIGTEHIEEDIGENSLKDIFENYGDIYEEPFGDVVSIPVLAFCKLASQQVKCVMSGEGADELFGGYRYHYHNIKLLEKYVSLPSSIRTAGGLGADMAKRLNLISTHKLDKIKKLRAVDMLGLARLRSEPVYFNDDEVSLLAAGARRSETFYDTYKHMPGNNDLMNIILQLDLGCILPGKNLPLIYNSSAFYNTGLLEPFTHPHLVKLVSSLPSSFKYKNKTSKYLLKTILHKYVPENIMKREGPNVFVPVAKWLNSFLKDYVYIYLCSDKVKNAGILNDNFVRNIVSDFYLGRNISPEKIFMLLTFQVWYEKWFS